MKSVLISAVVLLLAAMTLYSSAGGSSPRPDPANAAVFARWLINQSTWGTLSTLDNATKSPFGNIHSHADAGIGIPFFYQSTVMDRTGRNAVRDPRASFTVTEYALGFCNNTEAQSPMCAKLTLSGKIVPGSSNPTNSSEAKFGEDALIAEHPGFKGFPTDNNFDVFKLLIEDIFLVDEPAPPKNLSISDYLSVKL